VSEYDIVQDDIYNMNEIGFRIECINRRYVIIYTNIKAVYLADPNCRDWITTIEIISADGFTISTMIILAETVLLEKHFDNNLEVDILFEICRNNVNSPIRTSAIGLLQHLQLLYLPC
jgi:hypothetical protein